jgi:HAE1 family hydrophobic/amphiphilic exporter-1
MTTFTTVLGLLPLVIVPGAGSELYRGLGSVMLGGLVVSTFITLVLVPLLLGLCLRKPQENRRGNHDAWDGMTDEDAGMAEPAVSVGR